MFRTLLSAWAVLGLCHGVHMDWFWVLGRCYGVSRQTSNWHDFLSQCPNPKTPGTTENLAILEDMTLYLGHTLEVGELYWVAAEQDPSNYFIWLTLQDIVEDELWDHSTDVLEDKCVLMKTVMMEGTPVLRLANHVCTDTVKFLCELQADECPPDALNLEAQPDDTTPPAKAESSSLFVSSSHPTSSPTIYITSTISEINSSSLSSTLSYSLPSSSEDANLSLMSPSPVMTSFTTDVSSAFISRTNIPSSSYVLISVSTEQTPALSLSSTTLGGKSDGTVFSTNIAATPLWSSRLMVSEISSSVFSSATLDDLITSSSETDMTFATSSSSSATLPFTETDGNSKSTIFAGSSADKLSNSSSAAYTSMTLATTEVVWPSTIMSETNISFSSDTTQKPSLPVTTDETTGMLNGHLLSGLRPSYVTGSSDSNLNGNSTPLLPSITVVNKPTQSTFETIQSLTRSVVCSTVSTKVLSTVSSEKAQESSTDISSVTPSTNRESLSPTKASEMNSTSLVSELTPSSFPFATIETETSSVLPAETLFTTAETTDSVWPDSTFIDSTVESTDVPEELSPTAEQSMHTESFKTSPATLQSSPLAGTSVQGESHSTHVARVSVEPSSPPTRVSVGPSSPAPRVSVEPLSPVPSVSVEPSSTVPRVSVEPSSPAPRVSVEPSSPVPSVSVGPSSPAPRVSVGPSSTIPRVNGGPSSPVPKRCPCACTAKMPPPEMIGKIVEKIQRDLTVERNGLSRTQRKLISASDDRLTAKAIGGTGIVLVSVAALVIAIPDAIRLARYVFLTPKTL